MTHLTKTSRVVLLTLLAWPLGQAWGQVSSARVRAPAANVIVPQSRTFGAHGSAMVRVTAVAVGVVVVEQVATTTIDIDLENLTGSRQEAELIVPVPDGVIVRGFSFQGASDEPTAQVLPKTEAQRTYGALVAKIRDPALLEFSGYNLIRSSVFPVLGRGTQKVRLTYEHLLTADGDRVDYVLPRSQSLEYQVPWTVSVKIKAKRPISTVYSPSHTLETKRVSPNVVSVRIAAGAIAAPGPFRLSYLLEGEGVTASMLAYPDSGTGGGYFLLLAGLPASLPKGDSESAVKREVTLVFDRSGSMNGEKLEQVREAARQILAGLEPGEYFNIIAYNEAVDAFSPKPVAIDPGQRAGGQCVPGAHQRPRRHQHSRRPAGSSGPRAGRRHAPSGAVSDGRVADRGANL